MVDYETSYETEDDVEALAEGWKIADDNSADWAVGKINEEKAETKRLTDIAETQIEALMKKIKELEEHRDKSTSFLKAKLAEYFETVPHKETKTQESYKLLSGKLVFTKPKIQIEKNDGMLLNYLLKNYPEFVEFEPKIKWSEFKKRLTAVDGYVINTETGETIDCCSVTVKEGSFDVK